MGNPTSVGHHNTEGGVEFAHHFNSAEHEFETSKFGMWLFLVTEVMMFGGLFVGYIMFINLYPEMFAQAHKALDWRMGAANTVVLLISSLTMALGIAHIQRNNRKAAMTCLMITLVCGVIFMVVKYFEYTHKIHMGLVPGTAFNAQNELGINHPKANLFFGLYYMMTGLHGFHVLCGMGGILWVLLRMKKGEFNSQYFTPVELVGLFWHLIDLIWIYLFPLLYLVS